MVPCRRPCQPHRAPASTQAHDFRPPSKFPSPSRPLEPLPPSHTRTRPPGNPGPEGPHLVPCRGAAPSPHAPLQCFPSRKRSPRSRLRACYSGYPHLVLWRSAGRELHRHLQPALVGGGGSGGPHLHLRGEGARGGGGCSFGHRHEVMGEVACKPLVRRRTSAVRLALVPHEVNAARRVPVRNDYPIGRVMHGCGTMCMWHRSAKRGAICRTSALPCMQRHRPWTGAASPPRHIMRPERLRRSQTAYA